MNFHMTVMHKILELLESAATASGATNDQVIIILRVKEEYDRREREARSASPEEKTQLHNFLDVMAREGKLQDLDDVSSRDICRQAGVRANQGTASVARHKYKTLLLTHDSKKKK